jgi:hypothetical protein
MSSLEKVVQEILKLEEKDSTLICCFLWSWWCRRNKINARENVGAWQQVVGQARKWAAESLQFCGKQNDQCNTREVSAWRPPSGDILKLNIDGSFHAANKSGGWGFVIHDRDGDVRGSGVGHLSSVASAAQAEAHACVEAIQAAVAWGMTQVQTESDSQNLIRALLSKDYDLAAEGIYRDVRLSLCFVRFRLYLLEISGFE